MHPLRPILVAILSICSTWSMAQAPARPKLVVGIVVDQMRYDMLYRFQAHYGNGGFRRLLREGFSCEQTHYNYSPTYTGPGHAAIYTGTTPAVNGIIANDWWDTDPLWRKNRYVTADPRYRTVGGTLGKVGQHSPAVMLSTTVTDELRLGTNFRSKVVGVCLKDRGSILPAGHIPNAAYWFDDDTGNWITSTYYPDSMALPQWVQQFNARKLPDSYLSKSWEKIEAGEYRESFADWQQYKNATYGAIGYNFPHDLPGLKKTSNYGIIRFTPFGNSLTLDFALEATDKMSLGTDDDTDFLCISFSSTDYCGHQFGLHAEETEDVYRRLDRDIERLLDALEQKVGKNNVLVFLTADHGAAETPAQLRNLRIPAGIFEESKLEAALEQAVATTLGTSGDFVRAVNNQQVWLNWDAIADFDLDPLDVSASMAEYLRSLPGVYEVWTREEISMLPTEVPFASLIRQGIHPRRSGDLIFQLDPAWHADDVYFGKGGTTHGSTYAYDTHVPLLWYGWKIPVGESFAPVSITDIAPTLSAMLRIMEPNGTTGKVIEAVMPKQ